MNDINFFLRKIKNRVFKRRVVLGETTKAKLRREREGFFKRFCQGKGLDIGHGGDLVVADCDGWDVENGDAELLLGVPESYYDFVYSSHLLEHLTDPANALKTWWRVIKSGGFLILYIPHRDLYEKKRTLPSRWNKHHKRFFLLDTDDVPDTIGIVPLIKRSLSNFEIIYAKECREGHTIDKPETHSDGEYSIEVVVRKKSGYL